MTYTQPKKPTYELVQEAYRTKFNPLQDLASQGQDGFVRTVLARELPWLSLPTEARPTITSSYLAGRDMTKILGEDTQHFWQLPVGYLRARKLDRHIARLFPD